MITALRRLVKKDIVKVFSLTAVSTLVKMLTGFVSVKIVAALIGPAGIALLGQLNNFATIFLTLSTGGINSGVTKYVAEFNTRKDSVNRFLRSAVWITGLMSLLGALTLIIGSRFFSKLILQDVKYTPVILIFGCTITFYAFNSLLLSVLNGYKEFKKYILINIISSLTGLTFSGSLAFFFGVYGALISAVTFESVIFIITLVKVIKSPWFKRYRFLGKFYPEAGKKLANYSLMALISAATVPVSQLIIRSCIVGNTSLADAGLWEGMNRISAMYLFVITSSLSVYYLPRLSEIKTENELRREILSTYKIILPPLILVSLTIFLLRDFIIQILFNNKFQGMQNLFAFQLTGDFLKISSWILAYQMLARSMTKTYILTEIMGSVLYVGLASGFIKAFGNVGATIGYALSYLIYFTVMLIIFRKLIFRIYAK